MSLTRKRVSICYFQVIFKLLINIIGIWIMIKARAENILWKSSPTTLSLNSGLILIRALNLGKKESAKILPGIFQSKALLVLKAFIDGIRNTSTSIRIIRWNLGEGPNRSDIWLRCSGNQPRLSVAQLRMFGCRISLDMLEKDSWKLFAQTKIFSQEFYNIYPLNLTQNFWV